MLTINNKQHYNTVLIKQLSHLCDREGGPFPLNRVLILDLTESFSTSEGISFPEPTPIACMEKSKISISTLQYNFISFLGHFELFQLIFKATSANVQSTVGQVRLDYVWVGQVRLSYVKPLTLTPTSTMEPPVLESSIDLALLIFEKMPLIPVFGFFSPSFSLV